eukprot:6203938-Pleurochrysis_carterae.AAC.1
MVHANAVARRKSACETYYLAQTRWIQLTGTFRPSPCEGPCSCQLSDSDQRAGIRTECLQLMRDTFRTLMNRLAEFLHCHKQFCASVWKHK